MKLFTKTPGLILMCISLFDSSCTVKEYELELEGYKPRLVLDAFFTAGEKIKVNVASSRAITSTQEFSSVKNAQVGLYEDNIFMEYLVWHGAAGDDLASGFYYSEHTLPQAGKLYRVEVNAEGFDPVSAESLMPQPTGIYYIEHRWITEQMEYFNNYCLSTKLMMDNPPTIEKFYLFTAIGDYWSSFRRYQMPIINDPILGKHEGRIDDDYPLFTNEFITEESYLFYIDLSSNYPDHFDLGNTVYFYLATLSVDAFNYLQTRTLQKDNDIRFSEPISVYSNVIGGAGVFAAMNISCDSLVLN